MKDDNCLFCRIAAGEIAADLVFETDEVIGFRDINPQAPLHALFIPRRHIPTLSDASEADAGILGRLMVAAAEYACKEGYDDDGYRVTMNCREGAGQSVFHVHLHLLAGRRFSWPPG